MKIVYGVMESYKTRSLTEFSLSTWLKVQNLYVFTDRVNNKDDRFIYISKRDDYHSNAIKCILGLRYMFENQSDSDFYVYIDNDTFINIPKLEEFLSNKNPNELKAYGCVLNHWNTDPTLFYLSGGAGIILTKETMSKIYDKLEINEDEFKETNSSSHKSVIHDYSDVTLGFHMKNIGVELINSELFNSQLPKDYSEYIRNSISFHYLNTIDKMKKISNFFLQ